MTYVSTMCLFTVTLLLLGTPQSEVKTLKKKEKYRSVDQTLKNLEALKVKSVNLQCDVSQLHAIKQRLLEGLLKEANFMQLVLTKDLPIADRSNGLECTKFCPLEK